MSGLQNELNQLLQRGSNIQDFIHNSSRNCIWYKDLMQTDSEWMNAKFWESLGYDPSEIQNHSFTLKKVVKQPDLDVLLAKVYEPENSMFYHEIPLKHKDGHICWASCESLVISDTTGNKERLLVTLQDITKQKETELKLKDKTHHFNQIIEGTELGTWEWNIQTGETIFNEKWANLLGYKLAELQPISVDTWKKLGDPEDQELIDKKLQEHFDGVTDHYEFESRMKHKDGHWIWVFDKGKIVTWTEEKKPEWMIGYHQDITERKNSELLLIQYKNLLERCNEAARIGTWDMNLETQVLTWSKVTSEIHEVEPEFEPDVENAILFYKEGKSRDVITKLFSECVQSGISYDVELEITTAKGSIKWVRAVGIPEMKNEKCVHVYGLFQDIDDKKRAIEKLEFQEEQFRKTFEFAAIGMALVGLDGKWLKVNKSLSSMLGYSATQLLETSFQDITHPEDLSTDLKYVSEMLNNERDTYQMEKRYFHKNGSIVWVLLSVSLVKNDKGEPLHFVSQINNITARKEAEEKTRELLKVSQKQNEKLLNFAHIVSHNLRSHTGNVSMLLELMQEQDPSCWQDEYLPMIKSASSNLNSTVQHLNEVATINYHSNDNIQQLNLNEYVAKAIMNVKAISIEANAKIENTISEKCYVAAIPAYLDSILLNFLTNAIKYRSSERRLLIAISCQQEEEFCVIHIKDNGIGIDLNKNGDKLFGMYKTFHEHEEARGIGLFITKNQVEALGGKVEVESKLNRGSIFKIFLRNDYN